MKFRKLGAVAMAAAIMAVSTAVAAYAESDAANNTETTTAAAAAEETSAAAEESKAEDTTAAAEETKAEDTTAADETKTEDTTAADETKADGDVGALVATKEDDVDNSGVTADPRVELADNVINFPKTAIQNAEKFVFVYSSEADDVAKFGACAAPNWAWTEMELQLKAGKHVKVEIAVADILKLTGAASVADLGDANKIYNGGDNNIVFEKAAIVDAEKKEETPAPTTGDTAAATTSAKGSPDTGVADVAAVAGLAVAAAGAFVISKKRK